MDKRNIKYLEPRKTILEQVWSGLIKVTLFLVLVPTIFLFLIPGFLSLCFGGDIEVINDSALALEKIDIARDENAFYDLDKIKDVYEGEDGAEEISKYLDGSKWNQIKIDGIINGNEKELRYFDNASEKKSFILPTLSDPNAETFEVYSLLNFRAIARVAALRSLNSSNAGSHEQAFKEALQVIKVGELVESSQNELIVYLVGIAMKKHGLEAMEKIINKTKVNIYRLGYYNDFLDEEESQINVSALKFNYLIEKNKIIKVAKGKEELRGFEGKKKYLLKNNFYFKPNKTINLFLEKYNNIINYFEAPCYTEPTPTSVPAFYDSFFAMTKMYITENVIGEIYRLSGEVAIYNVKAKACENQARLDGLRIMTELKRYYLKNGELPNLLDDLIPNFASEIKNDSFSGIDFEYRKNEKKLISVGVDHVIDTEDDIIFDIDFDDKIDNEKDSNKI